LPGFLLSGGPSSFRCPNCATAPESATSTPAAAARPCSSTLSGLPTQGGRA